MRTLNRVCCSQLKASLLLVYTFYNYNNIFSLFYYIQRQTERTRICALTFLAKSSAVSDGSEAPSTDPHPDPNLVQRQRCRVALLLLLPGVVRNERFRQPCSNCGQLLKSALGVALSQLWPDWELLGHR